MKILLYLLAYLIGSIPTAVWIGKAFYKIDVREYGSGNAGATNTFRVLGKKAGIPVLLIDILKAFASVNLVLLSGTPDNIPMQVTLGIIAVIGHIFPVYAGFRGGKGIASLLGVVLALHPLGALLSLCLFIILLSISHYVSLSSIISAISFPLWLIFVFDVTEPALLFFAITVAALVLVSHQKNIERLIRKEESKIYIIKRNKKA